MKKFILFVMTFVSLNASAALTCAVETQFEDYETELEEIKLQGIDTQVGISKAKDITLTFDPRKPGVLNVQFKGEECIGWKMCKVNVDTALNGTVQIQFTSMRINWISCK